MRRKTLTQELVNDIIGQREAVRLKKMLISMPSVPKDNKRVFTFTEHSFFLY